MYSSDRMKTLIRTFKEYDKNNVFLGTKSIFLNIYLRRKEILLIVFRHFVELPAKDNRYWTTFETLAEIERENDNSTLHVRVIHYTYRHTDCSYYIVCTVEMLNVTLCNESPRGTWMVSNQVTNTCRSKWLICWGHLNQEADLNEIIIRR